MSQFDDYNMILNGSVAHWEPADTVFFGHPDLDLRKTKV